MDDAITLVVELRELAAAEEEEGSGMAVEGGQA